MPGTLLPDLRASSVLTRFLASDEVIKSTVRFALLATP
jgi:hypothetical protein